MSLAQKKQASTVEDNLRSLGVKAPPPLNSARPWELWRLVALLNLKTDQGVAAEDSFLLASLERWASAQARALDPKEVQRA
jgi:hypothetical protein